jgi:hypothetical protein
MMMNESLYFYRTHTHDDQDCVALEHCEYVESGDPKDYQ